MLQIEALHVDAPDDSQIRRLGGSHSCRSGYVGHGRWLTSATIRLPQTNGRGARWTRRRPSAPSRKGLTMRRESVLEPMAAIYLTTLAVCDIVPDSEESGLNHKLQRSV